MLHMTFVITGKGPWLVLWQPLPQLRPLTILLIGLDPGVPGFFTTRSVEADLHLIQHRFQMSILQPSPSLASLEQVKCRVAC